MSTLAKRMPFSRHTEVVTVMPPDFRRLSKLPFRPEGRPELEAWLGQTGWPREAMNAESLEGYLVALLAWPVDLPSGAWLPMIWGGRGWKLPAKLAAPRDFQWFMTLICSVLQDLDRQLTDASGLFIPTLNASASKQAWKPQKPCQWAAGFACALQQHAYGLKYRSMPARHAAETIVRWSVAVPTTQTAQELSGAVRKLVLERSTRGPLGPLISRQPGSTPGGASASIAVSAASSPSRKS